LMARQTAAEPMCGQTASNDLDAITVYAEQDQTSDTSESVSVTSPCAPDCSSLHWAASVSSKRGFAALIQRRPVEHRPKQVLNPRSNLEMFLSPPLPADRFRVVHPWSKSELIPTRHKIASRKQSVPPGAVSGASAAVFRQLT
jgi:hypothetical protein